MKRSLAQIVPLIAVFGYLVIPLLSQTESLKRSFDVVSIKPTPPGSHLPGIPNSRGDRFTMSGATLRNLLQYSFRSTAGLLFLTQSDQIIGGPDWIDSDRFDIEAKADCMDGPISAAQMGEMLQSLLETRFQLKAHLETRVSLAFDLVTGKGGAKIKVAEDQTPPSFAAAPPRPALCAPAAPLDGRQPTMSFDPRGPLPRGTLRVSGGPSGITISAAAVPLSPLINIRQPHTGRPVIDKTKLQGALRFHTAVRS